MACVLCFINVLQAHDERVVDLAQQVRLVTYCIDLVVLDHEPFRDRLKSVSTAVSAGRAMRNQTDRAETSLPQGAHQLELVERGGRLLFDGGVLALATECRAFLLGGKGSEKAECEDEEGDEGNCAQQYLLCILQLVQRDEREAVGAS
eukprot:scaffold33700_cov30-Tisochrysis_lutea.AAC.1